jgi:hypothetical protein
MDTDLIPPLRITQALGIKAAENVIMAGLQTCEKPLTLTSITNRAKCKKDAYFALALKQLCDSCVVLRCPSHAYWLASRGPVPPLVPVKPTIQATLASLSNSQRGSALGETPVHLGKIG